MGRWSYELYDSDTTLSFLGEIEEALMKEAAYVFSPEQVHANTRWLTDALTIIEIMNVFVEPDEYHFGLPVFLQDHSAAVMRWREAFFLVWDAEWNDTPDFALYSHLAYRVEHKHIAATLFDRLSDTVDYWRHDLPQRDLQPFAYLDSLPVFSLPLQDRREEIVVGEFLYYLIQKLTHHIVFTLSEENTERGLRYWDIEEVSVSVDLMGYLCELYRVSPRLRPATVQRWLDKLIGIWIDIYSDDDPENPIDAQTLAEKDGLYANVVPLFVRLITVAQQYPSWEPL